MGATAVYGLPYQELGDAPHGPNLGKNLADRVEAVLQANLTLGGDLSIPGAFTATGNVTGAIVNATSDVRYNGTSLPRGTLAGIKYTGAGGLTGAIGTALADTTMHTGNASLKTGRRYGIEVSVDTAYSATADTNLVLTFQLRKTDNTTVVNANAVYNTGSQGGPTTRFNVLWEYEPAADETNDFHLWLSGAKVAGTTFNWVVVNRGASTWIKVKDLGPSSLMATG